MQEVSGSIPLCSTKRLFTERKARHHDTQRMRSFQAADIDLIRVPES